MHHPWDWRLPGPVADVFIPAVVEGMWPWTPVAVELFHDFDIDFNRDVVLAEARGGEWKFAYPIYVHRDDILDQKEHWVEKKAAELLHAFRNREDWWVVPNNIELGEN